MGAVLAQLQEIFRTVLDDENLVLHESLTAAEVPGWDSLAHVQLLAAVCRKFAISFRTAEVTRLQSVGDLVALIERKRGGG